MPAKSEAQRKWAFGVKGEKWTRKHHMNTPGKLPARKAKKKGNLDAAAERAYGKMHKKKGMKPMMKPKDMMMGKKKGMM